MIKMLLVVLITAALIGGSTKLYVTLDNSKKYEVAKYVAAIVTSIITAGILLFLVVNIF